MDAVLMEYIKGRPDLAIIEDKVYIIENYEEVDDEVVDDEEVTDPMLQKVAEGDDPRKSLAVFFGMEEEQRVMYSVAMDSAGGEWTGGQWSPEHIIEAAHNYMINYQRVTFRHGPDIGKMKVAIVESFIAPVDMPQFDIKAGSWIMGLKIFDDQLWKLVKEGYIVGLSVGGYLKGVDGA